MGSTRLWANKKSQFKLYSRKQLFFKLKKKNQPRKTFKNLWNKGPKNVVKTQTFKPKPKIGWRKRINTYFQNTKTKEALDENCKKMRTYKSHQSNLEKNTNEQTLNSEKYSKNG